MSIFFHRIFRQFFSILILNILGSKLVKLETKNNTNCQLWKHNKKEPAPNDKFKKSDKREPAPNDKFKKSDKREPAPNNKN